MIQQVTKSLLILSWLAVHASCQNCTQGRVDLVFVVDSSGSICDDNGGPCDNWDLLRGLIVSVVNNLDVGLNSTRVGLVLYSDTARSMFYLNTYTNNADIRTDIEGLPYLDGNTNTSGGIKEMMLNQFTTRNGDREDVRNTAIIITDGMSTTDNHETVPSAKRAHELGIRIIAFGITNRTSDEELRNISSDNRFYRSQTFNDFASFTQNLTDEICTDLETTTAIPTPVTVSTPLEIVDIAIISPDHGPHHGCTIVSLNGMHLEQITEIRFIPVCESEFCNMTTLVITDFVESCGFSNEIIILTPPYFGNQLFRISYSIKEETGIMTDNTYEYMEDPIITDVYPRISILAGGIGLTLEGQHFLSVDSPKLMIYAIFTDHPMNSAGDVGNKAFAFESEIVTRFEDEIMVFVTPIFEENTAFMNYLISGPNSNNRGTDGEINDDNLNFYITFHFDGLERYREPNWDAELGFMTLYHNPEFEQYDGTHSYNRDDYRYLDIKGSGLILGIGLEEYTVTLGIERCQVQELTDNLMICEPPEEEPKINNTGAYKTGTPRLKVQLGNLIALIGYVNYTTNDWLLIIIICCMFFVVLVACIVTYCVCKKTEKKASDAKSIMEDSNSNDTD